MHTVSVLHKLLARSVPIHAIRLNAAIAAVQALTHGAKATVTSLGRHLAGSAFYTVLTQHLVKGLPEPVIVIDWSPLCADQSWQLLRAALPVGGRSITLYEEVHPQSKLGNRKVQHQFLNQLAAMIPTTCRPIIVADAGFRTPFYRYIENTLGWHWIGRIRGKDYICRDSETGPWLSAKSYYQEATTTAKQLGEVQWTQSNPFSAFLVLIQQTKRKRKSLTYNGRKRRSKLNKAHAEREGEPWLLAASLSLKYCMPKQIVKIYHTRMQIEEGFRDCKAMHYGLGLSQNRRMNKRRRSILCLLTSLAVFMLWCIGMAGKQSPIAKQVRVNSSSKREIQVAG